MASVQEKIFSIIFSIMLIFTIILFLLWCYTNRPRPLTEDELAEIEAEEAAQKAAQEKEERIIAELAQKDGISVEAERYLLDKADELREAIRDGNKETAEKAYMGGFAGTMLGKMLFK